MSRLIKILHIDPDYRITYFLLRSALSIRTSVSMEKAIELLNKEDFDLIVSEPHNRVIMKEQDHSLKTKPIRSEDRFFMETDSCGLGEEQSDQYFWNQQGS